MHICQVDTYTDPSDEPIAKQNSLSLDYEWIKHYVEVKAGCSPAQQRLLVPHVIEDLCWPSLRVQALVHEHVQREQPTQKYTN